MSIILRSGLMYGGSTQIGTQAKKSLYYLCLQHIRNVHDLGCIAKLMSFTQHQINFIEEVGTQAGTQARREQCTRDTNKVVKTTCSCLIPSSCRGLQLFKEVHALDTKTMFIDMPNLKLALTETPNSLSLLTRSI